MIRVAVRAGALPFLRPLGGGGGEQLGPELVVDGGFDNPAAWAAYGDGQVVGSRLVTESFGGAIQTNPAVVPGTYRVQWEVIAGTEGSWVLAIGDTQEVVSASVGMQSRDVVVMANSGNGVGLVYIGAGIAGSFSVRRVLA